MKKIIRRATALFRQSILLLIVLGCDAAGTGTAEQRRKECNNFWITLYAFDETVQDIEVVNHDSLLIMFLACKEEFEGYTLQDLRPESAKSDYEKL